MGDVWHDTPSLVGGRFSFMAASHGTGYTAGGAVTAVGGVITGVVAGSKTPHEDLASNGYYVLGLVAIVLGITILVLVALHHGYQVWKKRKGKASESKRPEPPSGVTDTPNVPIPPEVKKRALERPGLPTRYKPRETPSTADDLAAIEEMCQRTVEDHWRSIKSAADFSRKDNERDENCALA